MKKGERVSNNKWPPLTQEAWDRIMRETNTSAVKNASGICTRKNLKRDLSIYREYTSFNVSMQSLASKWKLNKSYVYPICKKIARLIGFRCEGGCWVPLGHELETGNLLAQDGRLCDDQTV